MSRRSLAGVLAAGLLLGACGARGSSPPATTSLGDATTTVGPTVPLTGVSAAVGTTITLTDELNGGALFGVELVEMIDPARPGRPGATAPPGERLVAAKLTILGEAGTESGDALADTTLVDVAGTVLKPSVAASASGVAGCAIIGSFGGFTVSAGRSATGCVTFAVPDGSRPAELRFTPDLGRNVASWNLLTRSATATAAARFLSAIAPFNRLVLRLNDFPAGTPPASPAYEAVAVRAAAALRAFTVRLAGLGLTGAAAADAITLGNDAVPLARDLSHVGTVRLATLARDDKAFTTADDVLRIALGLPAAEGA